MTELHIRVSLEKDGKTPKYEVMLDGVKIADISRAKLIDFLMQGTSSLRY